MESLAPPSNTTLRSRCPSCQSTPTMPRCTNTLILTVSRSQMTISTTSSTKPVIQVVGGWWWLVVVGLSGNCSRNKLERAVCDRDTSVVRDRDRFTLGREERVVQAMALSVNGVCGSGDGNGQGQSVVWDLEVYMLKVQSNSCFSQGSIYLCCDTVLLVNKNVFV